MSEIVLVTSNAEFNKLKNWAYENQIYISNETSNNIFDKYWTKVSINSKYTDKVLSYRPYELLVSDISNKELLMIIIYHLTGIKIDDIEYTLQGDRYVASFKIGEDCALYVNDYEYNRYTLALKDLDNAVYITDNCNAALLEDVDLIKHPNINVWYTKNSLSKDYLLQELDNYSDVFTVIYPGNELLFDEFCHSFNFHQTAQQPKDNAFVTLVGNELLNGEWFMNCPYYLNMIKGEQLPLNLPRVKLEIADSYANKYLIYGAFMFAYIKTLQNTPLALFQLYENVDIEYDYERNVCMIYFYADSYETIYNLKKIMYEPSHYTSTTFETLDEALNFRFNLSKINLRSLIALDNLTVISEKTNNLRNYQVSLDDLIYNIIREQTVYVNGFVSYPNYLLGVVDNNVVFTKITPLEGDVIYDYEPNNNMASFFVTKDDKYGNEITLIVNSIQEVNFLAERLQAAWNNGLFLTLWNKAWIFRNNLPSVSSDFFTYIAKDKKDQELFLNNLIYHNIND